MYPCSLLRCILGSKGYWDKNDFREFKSRLMRSKLLQDADAAYDVRISEAKAVFHQDMNKARLTMSNMEDENKQINKQSFWNFWNSDDMINKLNHEGIGLTFVMFQFLEIPTFQVKLNVEKLLSRSGSVEKQA